MKLFQFPPLNYQDWYKQIINDLDGKPINGPMINLGLASPIKLNKEIINDSNWIKWKSEESFFIDNLDQNKLEIKNSLDSGIESLNFIFKKEISFTDLEYLFDGIILDAVFLNFEFSKIDIANKVLSLFSKYCQNNLEELKFINGRILVSNPEKLIFEFKNLKPLGIELKGENAEQKLVYAANKLISFLENKYLPDSIFFKYILSHDFYENIVCINALKQIWSFVIADKLGENKPINCVAEIVQSNDPNFDLISSTSMAISAVVGGIDFLDITPMPFEDAEFGRKLSRNIHHILNYEANFENLTNPNLGAYLFENQSVELANLVLNKVNYE